MKRLLLTVGLVWASVGFCAGELSGDAVHTDEGLGIVFPRVLGGLAFRGLHDYEEPELGYCLRYESLFTPMHADVYVYDRGMIGIPTGWENDAAREEGDLTRVELMLLEMEGVYRNVRHVKRGVFPEQGDLCFAWDRFEFVEETRYDGSVSTVSECFVIGLGGRFVKLRFTYDKVEAQLGEVYATKLATDLSAVLQQSKFPTYALMPQDLLGAIKTFQTDPLSQESEAAMRLFIGYAVHSEDVLITIGSEACPWLDDEQCTQRFVLLAAFVAGNIAPQLKEGVAKDHTYEGVLQVIDTYRVLRQQDATPMMDTIEAWMDLQASGELKEALEEKATLHPEDDTQVAMGCV